MEKQSVGRRIAILRKQNGMTQLELAEKMGVTDKAVSKWERDLSCPDVASLPKLAELLGVSVNELLHAEGASDENQPQEGRQAILSLILAAIPLAMGVALAVLSILNRLEPNAGFSMAGIGLACIALGQLPKPSK